MIYLPTLSKQNVQSLFNFNLSEHFLLISSPMIFREKRENKEKYKQALGFVIIITKMFLRLGSRTSNTAFNMGLGEKTLLQDSKTSAGVGPQIHHHKGLQKTYKVRMLQTITKAYFLSTS